MHSVPRPRDGARVRRRLKEMKMYYSMVSVVVVVVVVVVLLCCCVENLGVWLAACGTVRERARRVLPFQKFPCFLLCSQAPPSPIRPVKAAAACLPVEGGRGGHGARSVGRPVLAAWPSAGGLRAAHRSSQWAAWPCE